LEKQDYIEGRLLGVTIQPTLSLRNSLEDRRPKRLVAQFAAGYSRIAQRETAWGSGFLGWHPNINAGTQKGQFLSSFSMRIVDKTNRSRLSQAWTALLIEQPEIFGGFYALRSFRPPFSLATILLAGYDLRSNPSDAHSALENPPLSRQ
jgi:hypothetical protein